MGRDAQRLGARQRIAPGPQGQAGRRAGALPQRQPIADHRRWWRQQRLAGAAVETRIAEAGQRTRPRHRGQPPAARHQQVEQDRAPPLLVHQPELARQTTRQLSRDRRADLGHHHQNRPPCAANSTPANIPAALSSRMPRWPRSTSNAPSSTASGTTPSHQIPIAQIARLSRDGP
jgi:hypothetical protein